MRRVKYTKSSAKYAHLSKGSKKKKTPNLDNLLKHQGHRKAKVSMPNVDAYTFYSNKNSMHVQSEHN
jgi:hypothetical protein